MANWAAYVKEKESNFRSQEFQKKFPAVTDFIVDEWLADSNEDPTEYKQQWYRNFIEKL